MRFVVLCARSPSRYLKKQGFDVRWTKTGVGRFDGFKIVVRDPAPADPLPDPSWPWP